MSPLKSEEFKLIKKFDSVDKLDECIYCEFYYTKRKDSILVNCTLCERNESRHKMQRSYRSCICFDENCDLKLKVLNCHMSNRYYVFARGLHPGKKIIELNERLPSYRTYSKKKIGERKYKSIPFINSDVYLQILLNCDYSVLNEENEIQKEISNNDLNFTENRCTKFLKLIKFEHNQSLSFIKTFLKNEITEEYSQAGYTPTSSEYFTLLNCVRYIFTCRKCALNKIISWYYIDKNILLVQSNGILCDCNFYNI